MTPRTTPSAGRDVGRLDGKQAVITGANSGVGFETAKQLAAQGAHVVLACRDVERGRHAADEITRAAPGARVRSQHLDLADLDSIRHFATSYLASASGLDLLVNNAGVAGGPLRRTADGFEMHFGTNYLGHFALTGLLLPALLASPGARVVTLSSSIAARGTIDFGNLNAERQYRFVNAYAQSKLACLMFAIELDRRAKLGGVELTSVASHPGIAKSNLLRAKKNAWGRRPRGAERAVALAQRMLGQPPEAAALTSIYAATSEVLGGGEYIGPSGRGHRSGTPAASDPPPQALDRDAAARLWAASAQLTDVAHAALNPISFT
jgi:NAD(P)-dependent dehydrogenase (short-subunit alcohol dehydrogenase family)